MANRRAATESGLTLVTEDGRALYWDPFTDTPTPEPDAVKTPLAVAIHSDAIIKRQRPLPWWLEKPKAEKRVVERIAKKVEASAPDEVAEQLVSRAEGILLAMDPGAAALAQSASRQHEYDLEEIKRIRAYWEEVERIVNDMIEEEEILWLLN